MKLDDRTEMTRGEITREECFALRREEESGEGAVISG